MRTLIISLTVAALLLACHKKQEEADLSTPSMVGKWTINSVTVVPFDSTATPINNGTTYPEPSYYYFSFTTANTWLENLAPEPASGLDESGTYQLHGDTSFTLTNTNAPAKAVECRIDTLTNAQFVFTYQRSTLYNGITPGYLEYIFHLAK
ncbi:MAG TPA: hypothetical protein VI385_17905 [Flavisolibacter sp.]